MVSLLKSGSSCSIFLIKKHLTSTFCLISVNFTVIEKKYIHFLSIEYKSGFNCISLKRFISPYSYDEDEDEVGILSGMQIVAK